MNIFYLGSRYGNFCLRLQNEYMGNFNHGSLIVVLSENNNYFYWLICYVANCVYYVLKNKISMQFPFFKKNLATLKLCF